MANILTLQLLAAVVVADTSAPLPSFPYTWDNISNYAFPGHLDDRFFTDAEVAHFSKFNLLLYWGIDLVQNNTNGPGWWVPDEEANSLKQAAAIKEVNPNCHMFAYITGFMAQTWFAAQFEFSMPEHSDWWLRDSKGIVLDCNDTAHNVCYGYSQGAPGKMYDWRIPEVRQYFVDSVVAPYATNANLSGIFLDDATDALNKCMTPPSGASPCTGSWIFTEEEQLNFMNGTLEHIQSTLSSFSENGKTVIFSSEVTPTSTPLNSSVLNPILKKFGAISYMEFFRGNQEDIDTALAVTSQGTPLMVHCSASNTIGPFSEREYCLAAFLIVAGNYSYFGAGSGWGPDSFPWYPEFDRPLGQPLGPAVAQQPGVYFRKFEHLNVTINTNTLEASIHWYGLGPVPGPPPPPPPPPFGAYTATASRIVYQDPPSYHLSKSISCSSSTYDACVNVSAATCDSTPGCIAFSTLSKSYTTQIYSELSPKVAEFGQYNRWWTTYQKARATPGTWINSTTSR